MQRHALVVSFEHRLRERPPTEALMALGAGHRVQSLVAGPDGHQVHHAPSVRPRLRCRQATVDTVGMTDTAVTEPIRRRNQPAYRYYATILRVVDGDTLHVRVDLGFRMFAELPVRLAGIDAPERGTDAGTAATEYARQWAAQHPTVILRTTKNPEKFGRWLGWVGSLNDDPIQTLNEALVLAGHALPWGGIGPRPASGG